MYSDNSTLLHYTVYADMETIIDVFCILLHLYPGFYSYIEGATWKILDLLTETLLI